MGSSFKNALTLHSSRNLDFAIISRFPLRYAILNDFVPLSARVLAIFLFPRLPSFLLAGLIVWTCTQLLLINIFPHSHPRPLNFRSAYDEELAEQFPQLEWRDF